MLVDILFKRVFSADENGIIVNSNGNYHISLKGRRCVSIKSDEKNDVVYGKLITPMDRNHPFRDLLYVITRNNIITSLDFKNDAQVIKLLLGEETWLKEVVHFNELKILANIG